MMKKEYRFLLVFVAIFAIALLCLILPHWTWNLPIFIPLGAIGIGFWLFMEGITEVCRGRTEHIIFNDGHRSVREKDIAKMPYSEATIKDKEKGEVSLGNMVLSMLNGFDYFGFTMPGSKSDPILIYPDKFHYKEQNNYHCYANLTKYKFKELPRQVKRMLELYPNRVDINKTPFYYGITSHFDGSATEENRRIEEKERALNKDIAEKDKLIRDLYALLGEKKTADDKQYILGNIIRPKDEA